MIEPTRKDIVKILEEHLLYYTTDSRQEKMSTEEASKAMMSLLGQQDRYARLDEIETLYIEIWEEDGAPRQYEDPPQEVLKRLAELKSAPSKAIGDEK